MRRGRGKALAPAILLSEKQKEVLIPITKNHKSGQQLVKRSNVLLLASEGISNGGVRDELVVQIKSHGQLTLNNFRSLWKPLNFHFRGLDKVSL